jgi:plasmid replication initiation protein
LAYIFASMEKKDEKKLLVQDNAITTARYSMTALEKNIMYMVMAQLDKSDPPTRYYRISGKELMERTHKKIKYEEFREATNKLLDRELVIIRENGNLLQIRPISSAEYDGNGMIEIGLDAKIRPYLFELKNNFTSFELNMALSLNSKFSKRMYEMLAQFRSTGILRLSVQELKERLKLFDPVTGKEQYEKWAAFEKYVLKVAQTEIAEHTDIKFDYKLKKVGKKITSIEFLINRPAAAPAATLLPPDPNEARLLERLMTDFRLRKDQAQQIIAKFPAKDINKTLYDISLKKEEVKNIGAYTAKTFGI